MDKHKDEVDRNNGLMIYELIIKTIKKSCDYRAEFLVIHPKDFNDCMGCFEFPNRYPADESDSQIKFLGCIIFRSEDIPQGQIVAGRFGKGGKGW